MKRTLLLLLLTMTGTSIYASNENMSESNSSNQATNEIENKVRITLRPEIVGLWGMEIDKRNKCTELYNFKSNNNVVINSGKEWSTGIYDYQASMDKTAVLPVLTVQIQHDNNEIDCSGHKIDQTGEVTQYSVKWKDQTTFNLCNKDNAEQCFATLQRVLP
jgi:hypothetical protein